MKVEIGNALFLISWLHYNGTIPEGSRRQVKKAYRQTICDIVFPNGEVFTGVSICSKKDNFCKETGRKISLTRALKEAGFTREARKQVWQRYFNRIPIKPYVDEQTGEVIYPDKKSAYRLPSIIGLTISPKVRG